MTQITIPLAWFNIRIDVFLMAPSRRSRLPTIHVAASDQGQLRAKIGPHLSRDIGLDRDRT